MHVRNAVPVCMHGTALWVNTRHAGRSDMFFFNSLDSSGNNLQAHRLKISTGYKLQLGALLARDLNYQLPELSPLFYISKQRLDAFD